MRRLIALLGEERAQARVLVDPNGRDAGTRAAQRADLDRAAAPAFWQEFERDRLAGLEFLENKIAPLALDSGFTFIRYVGTDVEAFMKAFDLAEVAEGKPIPPGQRGILLGKQYAEEWLKLKNARRLDQIKDKRDRFKAPHRQGGGAAALGQGHPEPGPRDPGPARPAAGGRGGAAAAAGAQGARGRGPAGAAGAALRPQRRQLRRPLPHLLRAAGAAAAPLPDQRGRHDHHQGPGQDRRLQRRST